MKNNTVVSDDILGFIGRVDSKKRDKRFSVVRPDRRGADRVYSYWDMVRWGRIIVFEVSCEGCSQKVEVTYSFESDIDGRFKEGGATETRLLSYCKDYSKKKGFLIRLIVASGLEDYFTSYLRSHPTV